MTSILDAPEMELELPCPVDMPGPEGLPPVGLTEARIRVEETVRRSGGALRSVHDVGEDGYTAMLRIIGPPHLVLRLIPGLYERELRNKVSMGMQQMTSLEQLEHEARMMGRQQQPFQGYPPSFGPLLGQGYDILGSLFGGL